ncbi:MAG: tryptophan synthase subunit alpha [Rickettsiales bacterium]
MTRFSLISRSGGAYPKLFSLYVAAGYPQIDSALQVVDALEEGNEVDFIELGMPFSDPVADGPTIQRVNKKALENGITVDVVLRQLEELRRRGASMPVYLMGHLNPIMQYGPEKFCDRCAELDVSGVVVPDMPPHIYRRCYAHIFDAKGVKPVFLISPHTPDERIREIDAMSERFIYAVSSSAITGGELNVTDAARAYYARVKRLCEKNPLIGGFGVSSKETFDRISESLDGAVIASAYLRRLEGCDDAARATKNFVREIREGR